MRTTLPHPGDEYLLIDSPVDALLRCDPAPSLAATMINTSRRSRVLLSLHAMIGSVYPAAAILQSLWAGSMVDRSRRRDSTLGQPIDERIMKVQTPTVDAAIERPRPSAATAPSIW